ncbi:major facilitator superfamily MFS_1 [Nitratiruptor sp. YY08-26]|uniref:MFS transporter n=1 Tax=unclassified Nitratiruptor TaxID=2624044 RepID=UPI00193513C3|nr:MULTISPECIES: MFS transporter [unclassified Nitratiruptor]BCD61671.1 major facilitator superfamily MFS_1 [Nitratiruptor sp. YY08-13]BCD65606.1 major facilitator superfamily MFS_1 [Nitratiruptor sp. YY08-26]
MKNKFDDLEESKTSNVECQMSNIHKIDRNVVVLGWVSFFTDMATAMINPILPIFVVVILHEGVDKLGIIVAVATFVSYALRLLSGFISDRYGIVKPLVVSGYALSALSKPLIGLSHSYKSVAALRGLERLGKALRSAPKDVLIASFSKKKSTGKTFGFHKTLDIAGELTGTLLAFFLLWKLGESEEVFRSIFFFTIIPGFIGLILVIFFVKDVPKKPGSKNFRLTVKDKRVIEMLFFYFLFVFFMWSDAFLTMQAKSVGIAVMVIPLLFAISTGTQTLTSYLLGVFIDRIGALKIMAFGFLSGIISLLLLFLQKPLFTWIAFAFFGLFTVATLNATRVYIAMQSDNKGSVYGVFYAGVALFGALGAYVCGLLWEHFGMYTALVFSLIGTTALLMLFAGKNYGAFRG